MESLTSNVALPIESARMANVLLSCTVRKIFGDVQTISLLSPDILIHFGKLI